MDTSWQTIVMLIVRHGLTTVAGALVTHGYLQSSASEAFIGGGLALAGVALSWWQKRGQALAIAFVENERDRWRNKATGIKPNPFTPNPPRPQ